jgi:hypothetical protein
MMELAKGIYKAKPFSGFVCASAERLPFETAAFDTVVCLRFMHLVPAASRRNIMKELARVASRRVIVSFGVGTPFQLLRLKVRHAILRGTSTPYPARLADLRTEIEEAGLHITQQRMILPIFSCEHVLTLEKKAVSPFQAHSDRTSVPQLERGKQRVKAAVLTRITKVPEDVRP